MPTPAWPASLPPYPVLKSVQLGSPIKAITRSEMDTGPAKTRKRVTAAVRPLSMTFAPLSEDQVDTFIAWHEDTVAMGALAFTITHPINDSTITVRFASVDGQFSIQERGVDHYSISVKLEIMP